MDVVGRRLDAPGSERSVGGRVLEGAFDELVAGKTRLKCGSNQWLFSISGSSVFVLVGSAKIQSPPQVA